MKNNLYERLDNWVCSHGAKVGSHGGISDLIHNLSGSEKIINIENELWAHKGN